ncbi:TREM1 protein, partial [Crotophaga sulcirostris]|nr:TREM1 protein [Crotophaga sulcirostris]
KKAWCRVRGGGCELLGETLDPTQNPHRTRARKGRVTMEDNHENRTVSITMTNLQVEDSGNYSCV